MLGHLQLFQNSLMYLMIQQTRIWKCLAGTLLVNCLNDKVEEGDDGEELFEDSELVDVAKELAGNALKHVLGHLLDHCRYHLHYQYQKVLYLYH